MKKILIIEDDKAMVNELCDLLKGANYFPLVLKDYNNPLEEIFSVKPDLILLDINIPYMNGQLVLQNLRKQSNVPVIMVTSKNTEIDEVLAISCGADDYITKPYQANILLLRIAAVLRRVNPNQEFYSYKGIIVNMQKGVIQSKNQEYSLTKNEMIILNYLLIHQNRIVTRDELMTVLWNNNEFINDNALTVNISRLRSKLMLAGCPNAIETKKKMGYILL